jgi:phage-related protein
VITFKIGQFVGLFLSLPFLIGNEIGKLPGIISSNVEAIAGFLEALPGRALAALGSFASTVGDAIRTGVHAAEDFVSSGVDRITGFIGSLPGRVRALGPALLDAARSLGRRIGDGLSEIGNFASNIGSRIVSAVKGGINRIIDGINSGIASIDDRIPISLPRLPHFERGGVVDSPTVALLGEKGKKEVVLPLTDPQRTRELAQQSGLTKILGSGGAAPTVNLTAVLDGFGLIRVIDMRVDAALGDQGAELAFGART